MFTCGKRWMLIRKCNLCKLGGIIKNKKSAYTLWLCVSEIRNQHENNKESKCQAMRHALQHARRQAPPQRQSYHSLIKVKVKVKGNAWYRLCAPCRRCDTTYIAMHDYPVESGWGWWGIHSMPSCCESFGLPVLIPSPIALTLISDPVSNALSFGNICGWKYWLKKSSSSIDSPKISQNDDSHHERPQRDRVPNRVNEIQTVKDVLLEKDNLLEHQQTQYPLLIALFDPLYANSVCWKNLFKDVSK